MSERTHFIAIFVPSTQSAWLKHHPAYRAFRARSAINGDEDGGAVDAPSADTPQEALDKAYLMERADTEAELLRRVVESPLAFLEVEDGVVPFASGVRAQGVVGYDNERGKGDHRHLRGVESDYNFVDIPTLLRDFWADVEAHR